ncbi:MAG TPA: hypothetical protein VFH27_10820, partial [Longimicrobiaceae bacterium]|nr:hypothetical protein [Longimicrobiaceae bacterium]
ATGQRWYEAHRNHAYQRAARSGLGHAAVTRGVLGVNAVLWALAAAGVWRPVLAVPCAAAGLAFLTGLYLWVERLSPMQGGGEKPVTVPGAGAADVPGVVHGRRRHLRTTQTGRGTAARVPRARHRDDG